jgi:hypothetical protein
MNRPSNTALALAVAALTAGAGVLPFAADAHQAHAGPAARCQFNSSRQQPHAGGQAYRGGHGGGYQQAPPRYVPPPPPWGYMAPPPHYYERNGGWYSPPNRQYRSHRGGRYRYESRDRYRY